jgi:GNAT superfamily N-acetyltransferase
MTIRELQPGEAAVAFEAMRALRPALRDADDLARRADAQRPEGYRLVASFAEGEGQAAAVAGFRIQQMLAHGRLLYVDDLATRPDARRAGHAGRLLDWLTEEATREGCDALQLDSGVGDHRAAAHRLYFNHGMRIVSHHFAREL